MQRFSANFQRLTSNALSGTGIKQITEEENSLKKCRAIAQMRHLGMFTEIQEAMQQTFHVI